MLSSHFLGSPSNNGYFDLPAPRSAMTLATGNDDMYLSSAMRRSALLSTCGGTAVTNNVDAESIAAIIDNKAGEVGIAVCSLVSLRIDLTQFGDSATFSRTITYLTSRNTVEVLLPSTSVTSRLSRTLQEHLDECNFIALDRKKFNETVGAHRLSELMSTSEALSDVLDSDRYLCVAAGAALVAYVESAQRCTLMPHTVRIKFVGPSELVSIDRLTVNALHLTSRMGSSSSEPSLVELIDKTVTPMGRRLLRANVVQPPRGYQTISLRLECTHSLTTHPHVAAAMRGALATISSIDLERATVVFSKNTENGNAIASFITSVFGCHRVFKAIPGILASIGTEVSSAALFQEIAAALQPETFRALQNKIEDILDIDILGTNSDNRAMQQVQTCFAVKTGVSGLLDAARRQYSISLDKVFALGEELKTTHSIPSLKLCHDLRRGYFISFDRKHEGLAPAEIYLHRSRKGKRVSCTTEVLEQLNASLSDAVEEILTIEGTILTPLLEILREGIGGLQQLAESIALLDMLVSNATSHVGHQQACTPEITLNDGPFVYVQSASSTSRNGPIHKPNEVLVTPEHPFVLLTGPNASGKTTYLRLVGRMVVLAHIGCTVPAAKATLRIVDGISTRMIGAANPMAGSSFMHEMREVAHIALHATRNTLVLVDELGAGTCSSEGFGIAWAVAEFLIGVGCPTLFTTHFSDLTHLSQVAPRCANYHFMVDVDNDKPVIRFQYSIAPGSCSVDRYGMRLARMVKFCDSSVLADATQKLALLEHVPGAPAEISETPSPPSLRTQLLQIIDRCGEDEAAMEKELRLITEAMQIVE